MRIQKRGCGERDKRKRVETRVLFFIFQTNYLFGFYKNMEHGFFVCLGK